MDDLHPSIKPWVGKNYDQARVEIAVVGESHYHAINSETYDPTDWYNMTDDQFVAKYEIPGEKDPFTTVGVVESVRDAYLANRGIDRSKQLIWAIPEIMARQELQQNPDKPAIAHKIDDIIFFNYFARPSHVIGQSLKHEVTDQDFTVATARFDDILTEYHPDWVFIFSRYVSRNIMDYINAHQNITILDHPNHFGG